MSSERVLIIFSRLESYYFGTKKMRLCCSWLGPGWALILLFGLFSATVLQSVAQNSVTHVIYFKDANLNGTVENTTVGKGMLFESRRAGCRPGFMRDHRNRCRRIV